MTGTPRHVIFGTGAIGLATLDALRRRGETARLVNRSGPVWHLANDPDTRTTRQLVDIVYRHAGLQQRELGGPLRIGRVEGLVDDVGSAGDLGGEGRVPGVPADDLDVVGDAGGAGTV